MSENNNSNPNCIFCQIVQGKLDAQIVADYQDENILVFKDHRPASDVHLLAIPKCCIERNLNSFPLNSFPTLKSI